MEDQKNTNISRTNSRKIIMMAVEVAFIFAIPAIVVGIGGPRLDSFMGTEKKWSIILLVLALVLSWTIVIIRYKKASKAIREKKNQKKSINN